MNTTMVFIAKYLYLFSGLVGLLWFVALPREQKKKVFVLAVLALPAIFIASRLASWLYFNPRPFVLGHFTPLIAHEADNGFPSDHVLLLSAIASLVFPWNKKVSSLLWGIALLVGVARVYVGVHHPVDIVASMLISILIMQVIIKNVHER